MPDRRQHRGPHPQDREQFAGEALPALRAAASDLCWMMSRGYATVAALKSIGDRYRLTKRQRDAVARVACSDAQLARRLAHRIPTSELRGRELWIDGFNVLLTVEVALGGGVVFLSRDACARDAASVHGTYRRVTETVPALEAIARVLRRAGSPRCRWFFDRPVSNSGKLAQIVLGVAREAELPWDIELSDNPDRQLVAAPAPVATADSWILDRAEAWVGLARDTVEQEVPDFWACDLFV